MTAFSTISLSRQARNRLLSIALATTALMSPLHYAYALDSKALPAGETIIGGQASFDRSVTNTLNINQQTDRLVIEWSKGFDIGSKAKVNFTQPDSNSIVVNRVTDKGSDPTHIMGELTANGRVVILDQNGVIFGKTAKVDVGGLVASTGNINDQAFLAGAKTLGLAYIAAGSVTNAGSITVAEGGLAAFVAPTVRNTGLIVARMGKVFMGDAEVVTLDLYGDGLFEVTARTDLKKVNIENSGQIDAKGGHILLTSVMADNVVKNLVNMTGVTESNSFEIKAGKIILGTVSEYKQGKPVVVIPEPEVTLPPVAEPEAEMDTPPSDPAEPVEEVMEPQPEPATPEIQPEGPAPEIVVSEPVDTIVLVPVVSEPEEAVSSHVVVRSTLRRIRYKLMDSVFNLTSAIKYSAGYLFDSAEDDWELGRN